MSDFNNKRDLNSGISFPRPDPLEMALKDREENKYRSNRKYDCDSRSKNQRAVFRMNGYRSGTNHLIGCSTEVLYDPPLVEGHSDTLFPLIQNASLALEHFNRIEKTNYKYVGLIKAYAFMTASSRFEIFFIASEPLVTDINKATHFRAMVLCKPPLTRGQDFTRTIEHVSKCTPPSTHHWLLSSPSV